MVQGQIAEKMKSPKQLRVCNLVFLCEVPRTVSCQYPVFILIYLLYMSFLKTFQLQNTMEIIKSQPNASLRFFPSNSQW